MTTHQPQTDAELSELANLSRSVSRYEPVQILAGTLQAIIDELRDRRDVVETLADTLRGGGR